MDKEEEKVASGEKDHMPPEDERSSTEECLSEAKEKEKGIVYALLERVGVFSGGFVSILSVVETQHVIKNIPWTTAKNFTVQTGWQQIEELISTWDIHESWLHHSEFLEEEELKDSKRYHYRVCWGLPTRRKPIPRATASVYFVIVISKSKPDTEPVEVFYRLESSRLIRRPEQCQFREKWLQDIIENKIACAERLASR
ncbi:A-kinase anchor protein 14 isoform X3 [Parus major]|nr:A-kinase anchor protein 14 isoform X3 [Parus major]XP_033369912.1 A-kinase anchor protein 14 isoform X3 [Parus major]